MKQREASPTFTPLQEKIFNIVAKNKKLSRQCYFTGGTALSAFYLHHRESEDLDFFSRSDFDDTYLDDFMKAQQFDRLPKMLVPLTLAEIKTFFREKAIEIGRRVTK